MATIEQERDALEALKEGYEWSEPERTGDGHCVHVFFDTKAAATRFVAALVALNS